MFDDETFFASLPTYLEELEEEGYTVIPSYMDRSMTAAIRDHLDAIIPMRLPGALPVVSGVNEIRHPIPGAIMPQLASNPRTLKLAKILLRSNDLRLREQILSRTDPIPPPYSNSFHIDAAFTLEEYEATPRQIFYQMIQYCSTVTEGGAAVMIIPRSHKLTYAVNRGDRTEDERKALSGNPLVLAGVDPKNGVEICANDGDLLIFNAMCMHGSSCYRTQQSRYVYFTSFYNPSATWLIDFCRTKNYRDDFPDSLRDGLAPELLPMLDR